jgi:hypothetical protein
MLTHRPDERLEDHQVSALLATPAYDAPWLASESDLTTQHRVREPGDNTTMMPGVVGVGVKGEETSVIKATRSAPVAKKTFNWNVAIVAAVIVVALLGVGLFFLVGSSPGKSPPTTTTRPPKTTTTFRAGAAALNALKSQVRAGETAGNVDAASGQTITQEAGFAQAAYTEGKTKQAASDLELAAGAIANGILNHTIGRIEGQLLQSDLGLFASALNLSSAVTSTTSTTSTTTTSSSTSTTTTTPPTSTTTTVSPTTTTTIG